MKKNIQGPCLPHCCDDERVIYLVIGFILGVLLSCFIDKYLLQKLYKDKEEIELKKLGLAKTIRNSVNNIKTDNNNIQTDKNNIKTDKNNIKTDKNNIKTDKNSNSNNNINLEINGVNNDNINIV